MRLPAYAHGEESGEQRRQRCPPSEPRENYTPFQKKVCWKWNTSVRISKSENLRGDLIKLCCDNLFYTIFD